MKRRLVEIIYISNHRSNMNTNQRNLLQSLALAGFMAGAMAQSHAADPLKVGNVTFAQQQPGPADHVKVKKVNIQYDVSGGIPPYNITLMFSADGGAYQAATSLTGDIAPDTPGPKTITWDAEKDWDKNYSANMKFKVKAEDFSQGLMAHYSFDGNANDDTGHGNHGVVYGATLTAGRRGEANGAYSFDGVNDYIDVGQPLGVDPADVTQAAWVKLMARNGVRDTIITQRHSNDGSDWPSLCIGAAELNGRPTIIVDDAWYTYSNPELAPIVPSPESITLDAWVFICGVRRGDVYQIYVNGQLRNSQTDTHQMDGSNATMHFMHHGAWGLYANGVLDEVWIFNRALNPQEVERLYQQ